MIVVLSFITLSAKKSKYPYQDPKVRVEERIRDLLSRMTLEEKVHQLATQFPNANMRLGIPNLSAGECLHGIVMDGATVFPQAIAMASSWDPELIEKMGHVVAKESRAFGIHQCYTPMLSVVRDVRWGRTEESYGEDPYLVGKIGTAYINGLQGTGQQYLDKDHIIATAKHFVADGEPMAGDNGAAMDVSDYNLHNVHMPPFKMAIEQGNVRSMMPAHHLLNGIPCHASKYLLNEILRKHYGWDGLIVSDNQDIKRSFNTFKYAETDTDAVRMALEAGIHQELSILQPWGDNRLYGDLLVKAVKSKQIDEKLVDNAVYYVLKAKYDLGLMDSKEQLDARFDVLEGEQYRRDHNIKDEEIELVTKNGYFGIPREGYREVINSPLHDELALEVARKSVVLLKNEDNILPLNTGKYKKIAVIGPNADAMRLGGYSPEKPKYFVTILEGLKSKYGEDIEFSYAKGCDIASDDTDKMADAVTLAQNSDLVVLAIGGSEETCRENEDRDDLNLAGVQTQLVQAIHKTGKPYVVVLLNGRPLSVEWTAQNAPVIIEGWYLGQETGTAIAEVLFGEVNPGGKLPITFPRNVGQVPLFYNKLETGRPRRIHNSSPEPLFPFGFGLSYTDFKISEPVLDTNIISRNGKTSVSVDVTNAGQHNGDEVVQLYINDLVSSRVRPAMELRGFERITLAPGESRKVSFEIGKEQLEYWLDGQWIVESGDFEIMIGNSSANVKKAMLKVK
ncbi:glycoside hydrolase family 3 N-terminal domain-containing protein [Sunxiuqinia sp. sy24]|uniref:glycoside hydrolase family 3 N-terminal domain-containing protein n=1 Tax=Sunxiuqinia sp. sy24 TaxID=3461495 RepID=UPI004045D9CC